MYTVREIESNKQIHTQTYNRPVFKLVIEELCCVVLDESRGVELQRQSIFLVT